VVGVILPEEDPLDYKPGPVKTWMLLLSTLMVLSSLAIYATIIVVIPPFGDLFAEFGATLPILTMLVLNYSKYSVALVLIGVVPLASMWRYRLSGSPSANRDFRWVVTGFGISMVVLGIAVIGVYLPVFMMGAATS
jgi:hypothetical protein